jgi:hypothetical protein
MKYVRGGDGHACGTALVPEPRLRRPDRKVTTRWPKRARDRQVLFADAVLRSRSR